MAINEYALFLDESGEFMETSKNPDERKLGEEQKFASQIAGFLAPIKTDVNISEEAQKVMNACFKSVNLKSSKTFKSHDGKPISIKDQNQMVLTLIKEMKRLDWQPVRLVNKEKVSYGNRVSIYTNMVAELVLRLFQEKAASPQDKIAIKFLGASVSLRRKTDTGIYVFDSFGEYKETHISKHEYEKRFNEYLAFAAVRRGLAKEQLHWKVKELNLDKATEIPELQICDLLSNASHRNYKKCSRELKPLLKAAFGSYDQTMETHDLLERIDVLVNEQTFGVVLWMLAESLYDNENNDYSQEGLHRRLKDVIGRLVQVGVRGRDAHLSILIAWLDQLIGQQRLNEAGYLLAQWLIENAAKPLQVALKNFDEERTLDWFAYSLRRWALTAANHRGALLDAEIELREMRKLQPSLATQWERTPLLMEGSIAQAVHQTDCFEFDEAAKQMKWIADSLKLQTDSFTRLLPQVVTEPIRYDACAKALGTWAQCLTLSGFKNSSIAEARRISDEAIEEFSSANDKSRQYQYRCHLETIAGDFAAARHFLVKSFNPKGNEDASNARIKNLLKNAVNKNMDYRFALQHWLRIGARACHTAAIEERDNFLQALKTSNLLESRWCSGREASWPAHSILRSVAVIHAVQGNIQAALDILGKQQAITPIDENHLVLPMMALAADAEVSALIWKCNESIARKLLNGSVDDVQGVRKIINAMFAAKAEQFPAIKVMLNLWRQEIDKIFNIKINASETNLILLNLASEIRY